MKGKNHTFMCLVERCGNKMLDSSTEENAFSCCSNLEIAGFEYVCECSIYLILCMRILIKEMDLLNQLSLP